MHIKETDSLSGMYKFWLDRSEWDGWEKEQTGKANFMNTLSASDRVLQASILTVSKSW